MELKLYNTLSKTLETFVPIKTDNVSVYSCGPTVYDYAHIGNFRAFLMSDLLVRTLTLAGHNVTKVMNITDVGHLVSDADTGEDKMLKAAKRDKKDPYAIAKFYEEAFINDEKKLRILPPTYRPRATDYIAEQIDMTKELINKDMAYVANGSVYFRTQKFKNYGKLSGNNLQNLLAGARVEVNTEKEDPLDFALWKHAEPNHIMQWDSPWGMGFPGWHIECSAMSKALLGEQFDVHTGGEDNVFPHHECEIAQNEACSGKKSVNYWLHTKHLLVDGVKMSKSLGNFYTIKDLTDKGYTGAEIRLALMNGHYRNTLNFSLDGLDEARANIKKFNEAKRIFASHAQDAKPSDFADSCKTKYKTSLCHDLNVPEAMSHVFDMIKDGMKARDINLLTPEDAASIIQFLQQDFDAVFAVLEAEKNIDTETQTMIENKIEERKTAKQNKDFATADSIRSNLLSQGIELIDDAGGTTWKHTS